MAVWFGDRKLGYVRTHDNATAAQSDVVRVRHMIDAARDAVSFAEGRGREDLETDRLLAMGLVRCIEIIGEAAGGSLTTWRGSPPPGPSSSVPRSPGQRRLRRLPKALPQPLP